MKDSPKLVGEILGFRLANRLIKFGSGKAPSSDGRTRLIKITEVTDVTFASFGFPQKGNYECDIVVFHGVFGVWCFY